ncbi:hypothetical protein I549_5928 [Mycobacterium avium subsp. avium 2285 (R)]|nr:hypothetical protein L837_3359 [Mycobacterium avium MAV_061107_1842]EUA41066.1 hypothetical protein I549_5928 [Mycobacterium avium subsp. avium 2285 (R)]
MSASAGTIRDAGAEGAAVRVAVGRGAADGCDGEQPASATRTAAATSGAVRRLLTVNP